MLVIVSVLSLTVLPAGLFQETEWYAFPYRYLLAQTEAMARSAETQIISDTGSYPDIRFNRRGNVSKAMTLEIGKRQRHVIVELGGGRLVFPEEQP